MISSQLFNRYWQIIAQDDNEKWTFGNLAIEFSGTRTADTKPGEMELTVYNLNDDSRAFVERKGTNIEVYLGYKAYHGLCFKGAVEFGSSQLTPPSPATKLTLRDGSIHWRNMVINKAFKAGTKQETVIEELIKQLTGLPDNIQKEFQKVNQGIKGQIDAYTIKHSVTTPPASRKDRVRRRDSVSVKVDKRTKALAKQRANNAPVVAERGRLHRAGSFAKLELLCKNFGLQAIWDKQTLSIIPLGLVLPNEVIVIAPGAGLIGSPEIIEASKSEGQTLKTGWKFTCELHHELSPGALVQLESEAFTGTLVIRRLDLKGQSHGGGDWVNIVEGQPYDA